MLKNVASVIRPVVRGCVSTADEVFAHTTNQCGIITMNRPSVLNALNITMIRSMYPTLKEWRRNKELTHVIMESTTRKAFCAGGDIKQFFGLPQYRTSTPYEFFSEEYRLNLLIHQLGKPMISFIIGTTMGGGVGISIHGQYRVASENTVFAMPEARIGLNTDVGGSYFLARLPRQLGVFMGLTGFQLRGSDTLHAGIATHFADSPELSNLRDRVMMAKNSQQVAEVLNRDNYSRSQVRPFSLTSTHLDWIEKHFQFDSVERIISSLQSVRSAQHGADEKAWTETQLEILHKMSPTSLKLILRQIREGATKSMEECLRMEYRLCIRCYERGDFAEGVRSVLVDRDNNPQWNPARLRDVTPEYVDGFFAPFERLTDEWTPNDDNEDDVAVGGGSRQG